MRAKFEKIVGGAKALLLQQRMGAASGALLETRLQNPDLFHHRGKAARDGELVSLQGEHVIHRVVQGGDGALAARLCPIPRGQHFVPEQGGKEEGGRNRPLFTHAVVGLRQRQHDKALAHGLFENHIEHGQYAMVQPFRAQPLEAGHRVSGQQQFLHLVEHARGRHVFEKRRQFADRRARLRVDMKAKLGGKAHRAQHAHRVFAIAQARIADDTHGFRLHVLVAAVVIEHRQLGGVEIHGVAGEVAPRGVLLAVAKNVVAQHAAVLVSLAARAGAEGRDFHGLLAEHDVNDLEAASDQAGAAEKLVHFLRVGVGGDVEILWFDAKQQVAHSAAHDVGLVALCLQRLADLARTAAQALGLDAVAFERDGFRLGGRI